MNDRVSLLNKYNIAVPRYTSYPPANHFHDSIKHEKYVKLVHESNTTQNKQISLYFHVPFCSELCFYCGCNTYISKDKSLMRNYFNALKNEVLLLSTHLDNNRKVSQIHWGGGTPNYMPIEWIQEMMELIDEKFQLASYAEIAMECHPFHLSVDYIDQLINLGFNRISLGIQDFESEVLKAVNRKSSNIPIDEIVKTIRQHPQVGLNFDFIYGLPHQNSHSFMETIHKAIELNPDRIVTFSYAHVPWLKKSQILLEKIGLPDAAAKFELYQMAYQLLTQNHYHPIGLDHFAKANDELTVALNHHKLHRNFQGYCTHKTTGQVYAIGVTGISQLDNAYAQNTKNIEEYQALIDQKKFPIIKGYELTSTEKTVRAVINEIMCNQHINWELLAENEQKDIDTIQKIVKYREGKLDQYERDELIVLTHESISVTEKGRSFIRNIASEFDPEFHQTDKKFSKSI